MKLNLIRKLIRWHLKSKHVNRDSIDIKTIDNILVMSNTAIGDTLFTTPAIRSIKESYPDMHIIALLNPDNYQLFEDNPFIDEILLYKGKWRNFFTLVFKLKRMKIDLALIMHSNEPQATPLAYYAGCRYIVKIPNDNNEFNFLHHNSPVPAKQDEHFIDRRLKQLEYIDIHTKNYRMDIFINPQWYEKFSGMFSENEIYIGFQMGASTKSRMWFPDRWVDLANMILKHKRSWNIVLTGSKSEASLARDFLSSVPDDRVINFVGKLDIGHASALIDKFDLLVTPDTGPLHIAAALQIPTVAISVAGSATESNPRDHNIPHIFIEEPKTCNPCIDKRCKYQKCMLQITPNQVFQSICQILG